MDLHFETPEDAVKSAKSLRAWGDHMERHKHLQAAGTFFPVPGGMCALGSAILSMGLQENAVYERRLDEEFDLAGLTEDVVVAVAAIAARQTEKVRYTSNVSIPVLNDVCGVTFPEFATACRSLAAIIEEYFPLPSAPIREREAVPA